MPRSGVIKPKRAHISGLGVQWIASSFEVLSSSGEQTEDSVHLTAARETGNVDKYVVLVDGSFI